MSTNVLAVGKHPMPNKPRKSKSCVKRMPKSQELSLSEYFGPGVWYSLHTLALAADNGKVKRSTFIDYAKLLASDFPCADCRDHYSSMVNTMPKSRFFEWTVKIHNRVNTRLNKTSKFSKCIMSTSEARNHIQSIKAGYTPEGSVCTECRGGKSDVQTK